MAIGGAIGIALGRSARRRPPARHLAGRPPQHAGPGHHRAVLHLARPHGGRGDPRRRAQQDPERRRHPARGRPRPRPRPRRDEPRLPVRRGTWLRHVLVPQLEPYVVAAARSGLALVWKIVLVVELLGRPDGVGYAISYYFQLFDVAGIARLQPRLHGVDAGDRISRPATPGGACTALAPRSRS